ncbi:hypothetical protein B0H17DRAFT_1196938 [Mycena rosella]|uniref:F-box domain-containing protein n=1 Tax=Mycena rosella TaxID=1033263 RepID=A0AAD7DUJ6_MYCRO|nr:hypothetical protein B0H17DRAFT_1196938 [Mycena rosella]
MANSPGFSVFPPEIVDEIVQRTPPVDLFSLCRVERRLHDICVPYIYEEIELVESGALLQFSDALRSRPYLSELVKALTMWVASLTAAMHRALSYLFSDCHEDLFARPHKRHIPPYFSEEDNKIRVACATAISGFNNLVYFQLTRPWSLLPLLPFVSLQCLRSFATTFSNHLAPFLDSHPQIEELHIQRMEYKAQFHASMPHVHLQALREFTGPELVASAVIPDSRVRTPTIWWAHPPMRLTSPAKCLALIARASSITELHNMTNGWDAPNPFFVATALPNLTLLRFQNLRRDSSPPQREKFHTQLLAALPAFHYLETLTLDEPARRPPFTRATFNAEWDLLHAWYSLCPTLRKCTLLSGLRWKRPRRAPARWIPVNDGSLARPGKFFKWFMQIVLTCEHSVMKAYLVVLPKLDSEAISLVDDIKHTRFHDLDGVHFS